MSSKVPVLSVRVSASERDVLAQAAKNAHTNVSDFVRRKALEAAEIEMAMHPLAVIPDEAWGRFEAWASAPAKEVPALQQLATRKPVWRE